APRPLLAAYNDILKDARRGLDGLGGRIETAQRAGLVVQPWWVYEQARAAELIREVEARLRDLGSRAAALVEAERGREIALGLEDARRLMGASGAVPTVIGGFTLPPIGAVEQSVASFAPGSSLVQLFDRIGPEVASLAQGVLAREIAAGRGGREIGRSLAAEIEGLTRRRATLIARTEVNRAYRAAHREAVVANQDLFLGVRWVAAMNSRTCVACMSMNGRLFPVDYVMASHPACRCRVVPVTPDSLPPLTSAEQYLEGLTDAEIDRRLGRIGGPLYRAGHLSIQDFARVRSSREWGDAVQPQTQTRLLEIARERSGRDLQAADVMAGRLAPAPRPALSGWTAPREILRSFRPLSREADALTRELFRDPVEILATPSDRRALERLCGRRLQDWEIADLACVPGGGRVQVWADRSNAYLEGEHPYLVACERVLLRTPAGLVMDNRHFRLGEDAQGKGIALRTLGRQAIIMQNLGGSHLMCNAYRSDHGGYIGYHVWPSLGYDGEVPEEFLEQFPGSPARFADLRESPEWMNIWMEHGTSFDAVFNLEPGSRDFDWLKRRMQLKQAKFSSRERLGEHYMSPDEIAAIGHVEGKQVSLEQLRRWSREFRARLTEAGMEDRPDGLTGPRKGL
ncbi:MAG: minor capsid protein, partial [Fimbriimonadaceae bacterium]|nr:minor capsid protein [Fimbriimonadaceae bacterium]